MFSQGMYRLSLRRVMNSFLATIHQKRFMMEHNDVLGTSIFAGELLTTIQNELKEEELRRSGGVVEAMHSCIRRSELDHLESPEADAAHLRKVDRMIENLFNDIPLPADPMTAALAPSREELIEKERNEVLKEAVREQYLRRKNAEAMEERRLEVAMQQYERKKKNVMQSESLCSSFDSKENKDKSDDTLELRRQIDEMKKQVAHLEGLLDLRSRSL